MTNETMTNEQGLAILDTAHAAAVDAGDLDGAARIELIRELARNPAFRRKLADYCFERTY